jgi:ELWxxDGT repeat protein
VDRLEDRDQPTAAPLADLNPTGASAFALGNPWVGGAAADGAVYFFATDGTAAPGLFKSDGTAAGTALVKDLSPAVPPAPGALAPTPAALAAAGGKVFFPWDDGATGTELWASDGTKAGTKLVKDLAPAAASSQPQLFGEAGGKLVFGATPAGSPYPGMPPAVLYASDGTAAGTVELARFASWNPPRAFTAAGGRVYWTVQDVRPDGTQANAVWVTDGTAAGTKALAELPAGVGVSVDYFTNGPTFAAAGGTVFFAASSPDAGTELWAADAGGARQVKDIKPAPADPSMVPYPGSSMPREFATLGGKVYFVADDGVRGDQLWATDGTDAGTARVADLGTAGGTDNSYGGSSGARITGLTAAGGRLYFSADGGTDGPQFYTSDGTAAGTVELTAVAHTPPAGPAAPIPLPSPTEEPRVVAAAGGRVFFTIGDKTNGRQLWATDGTKAGTAMLRRFAADNGPFGGAGIDQLGLGVANGRLLFAATDPAAGRELFATDGTAAGTRLVKALNPGTVGSDPREFVSLGAKAVFVATDGTGTGVYATDGRSAPALLKRFDGPTGPLAALDPRADVPQQLTRSGGSVYFITRAGGAYGRFLWATDGTAAGTRLVKELPAPAGTPTYGAPTGIDNLTDVNGTLYFTIDAKGQGQTLWRTDGTPAGTRLVKTLNAAAAADNPSSPPPGLPGAAPSAEPLGPPRSLTAVGGKLYFVANDGTHGEEVWVSDGTDAGTKLVKDVGTRTAWGGPVGGTLGSTPGDLVSFAGKLFYTAAPNGGGRELWSTDGTAGGTARVAVLTTADSGIYYGRVTFGPETRMAAVAGDRLIVAGTPDAGAAGLWASDGTAAGTKRLTTADVPVPTNPYGSYGGIGGLTAAGDHVFFVRQDGTGGPQLWTTDGTAAGTAKLATADLPTPTNPYSGTSDAATSMTPLTPVGDRVLFAMNSAAAGRELWVSDGTKAGTRMLADANPGKTDGVAADGMGWFSPNRAAVAGDRVVYAGATGRTGAEPWAMPLTDVQPTLPPVSPPVVPPVVPPVTVPPVVPPTVPPVVPPTVPPVVPPTVPPPKVPPVTSPPATTPPVTAPPVRPAVVRTFAVSATEGTAATGNLATVTLPPGTGYTVTVYWGDGKSSAGTLTRMTATGSAYTVAGTHTYDAVGTRKVTVRVMDGWRTLLSIELPATVADARFYAARVAQRAAAGDFFSGTVATVSDLNPGGKASDFTATISWGDGRTSAGTLRRTAAGRFEVVGNHTFASAGKQAVTVIVRSTASGKTATVESLFTIDPKPGKKK